MHKLVFKFGPQLAAAAFGCFTDQRPLGKFVHREQALATVNHEDSIFMIMSN
jgi:hypothetical protein